MLTRGFVVVFAVVIMTVTASIGGEIQYLAQVKTGFQDEPDPYAKIFIRINGTEGRTREVLLNKTDTIFEKGPVENFELWAEDVGPPLSLTVWHEDSRGYSTDWYLKQILLTTMTQPKPTTLAFNCGCWMVEEEVSTLYVEDKLWYVTVTTSNIQSAGTDGRVSILINGDRGQTRPITLNNDGHGFERASSKFFILTSVDIGTPSNISVTVQSDGKSNRWHLDSIGLSNPNGGAAYSAHCDCWFDANNDQGEATTVIQLH